MNDEQMLFDRMTMQDISVLTKTLMRKYVDAYGSTGNEIFQHPEDEIWTDTEAVRMQLAKILCMGTALFASCRNLGLDPLDTFSETFAVAAEADSKRVPCAMEKGIRARLRAAFATYKQGGPNDGLTH